MQKKLKFLKTEQPYFKFCCFAEKILRRVLTFFLSRISSFTSESTLEKWKYHRKIIWCEIYIWQISLPQAFDAVCLDVNFYP